MSDFDTYIDSVLGDSASTDDITMIVRRLWLFDFLDDPLRIWDGKGLLHTVDGNEWLGTIDQANNNHHESPRIQDGRDGSSPTYTFGLTIPDLPGENKQELYDAIKAQQSKSAGRNITCYIAAFELDEGLRPQTPIVFYRQFTMFAPKFSERIEADDNGVLIKNYKVSITAKDANFGRSEVPGGTYSDTVQKRRATELGESTDRGCEFVALLANKTYTIE